MIQCRVCWIFRARQAQMLTSLARPRLLKVRSGSLKVKVQAQALPGCLASLVQGIHQPIWHGMEKKRGPL